MKLVKNIYIVWQGNFVSAFTEGKVAGGGSSGVVSRLPQVEPSSSLSVPCFEQE